jgi:hypothetical protein
MPASFSTPVKRETYHAERLTIDPIAPLNQWSDETMNQSREPVNASRTTDNTMVFLSILLAGPA